MYLRAVKKCHYCAVFAGVSATYLGGKEGMLTKKRGGNRKKERCSRYASLCGRGDLLKAQGLVALFLLGYYHRYTVLILVLDSIVKKDE
jgi:hypothetical protein